MPLPTPAHAETTLRWPRCRARGCDARVAPASLSAVTTELGRFCTVDCLVRHYNHSPLSSYENWKVRTWAQDWQAH